MRQRFRRELLLNSDDRDRGLPASPASWALADRTRQKRPSPQPSPTRARVCGSRVAARGEREPTEFAAPVCLIATELTPFERKLGHMFFVLSKILGFFAYPSNIVIVAGVCGVLLVRTRFARGGWQIASASLVLLAIFGFSPAGNALMIPLEGRFPAWDASRGPPDGIVALGGGVTPDVAA